jgi:hypothetical protein
METAIVFLLMDHPAAASALAAVGLFAILASSDADQATGFAVVSSLFAAVFLLPATLTAIPVLAAYPTVVAALSAVAANPTVLALRNFYSIIAAVAGIFALAARRRLPKAD